ncbi:MAG: CoA ligase, partial [Variovorax sp.]
MNARLNRQSAALLPLLGARDLDAPLAWRAGTAISAQQYLADVALLATRLPAAGPVLNLCVDRYAFAVGLGAALSNGLPSLLPPDARPDTLARLREGNPDVFSVADDRQFQSHGMPVVWIDPRQHADLADAPGVPDLDVAAHAVSLLTSGSTGLPQPHGKTWQTLVGDVAAAVPR